MIYLSTFIAGTKDIVAERLKKEKRAKILGLFDSLVLYEVPQGVREVESLCYLNNSFILIQKLKSHKTIAHAVNELCSILDIPFYGKEKKSFRFVYSEENSFTPIPDRQRRKAELYIAYKTKRKISRSKPDVEYWIIKDRNAAYFVQRLTSKNAAKGLKKGQLRPELADIMCYLSMMHRNDVVCDPFCGYGAISGAALRYAPRKIIACDKDADCVRYCRKTINPADRTKTVLQIEQADLLAGARSLPKNSVDKIITDPPWGFFDKGIDIGVYYREILTAIRDILRNGGMLVILTAREIPMEAIRKEIGGFTSVSKYEILVNGKKAALYTWKRT